MARRDASLRLTLEDGAFSSGIRKLGNTVTDSAQKMGQALKTRLHEGLEAGIHSVQHLTHRMHDLLHVVTSIGGTVSFLEMTHQAISAEDAAGRLAMKMRRLGDAHAHAGHVLEDAVAMSKKYALTTGEVLTAYEALVDKTGQPIFSRDAIESVGLLRNAFHTTAEASAEVVGMFQEKLGASVQDINGELGPALMGLLQKNKVSFETFASLADRIGQAMYRAGMHGKEGLGEMVSMLGVAGTQGGNAEERIAGMQKLFEKLGSKKSVSAFGKEAHLDVSALLKLHTVRERMMKMMETTSSFKALDVTVGEKGGGGKFFSALTAPFREAQTKFLTDRGIKEGSANPKMQQESINAGLEAFRKSLDAAAETTATEHDLREEAVETTQETERKLQLAMNRMATALENEKFLSAMSRLADVVPLVAEKFEKLVGLALDHPGAAGAAIVGGTFAQGAIGGLILGKAGKHVAKHVAGHLIKSAAGAAVETAAAGAAETAIPAAITAASTGGAAAAGGGMAAVSAVALPLAIAVAAGLGLRYGINAVSRSETDRTRTRQLVMGNADVALTSGSLEKKKRALQELRDFAPESHGGRRSNVDKDVAEAKKQLQEQIDMLGRANDRQIASVEAVTRANERLARSTTARGVNPPAPVKPGAAQEAGDT